MAVFSLSKGEIFTPTYEGNDKNPNPVRFHYRTPTVGLKNDLLPRPQLAMNFDEKGEQSGGTSKLEVNTQRIVLGMTTKVEGIEVQIEGKSEPLTLNQGADLYGAMCPIEVSPYVEEYARHLQGVLSKAGSVNEKN